MADIQKTILTFDAIYFESLTGSLRIRNHKKEAQVYCIKYNFYLRIWIIFKETFKFALRQIYWIMYFTVRGRSSRNLHLNPSNQIIYQKNKIQLKYSHLYKDPSLFQARIQFLGDQILLM